MTKDAAATILRRGCDISAFGEASPAFQVADSLIVAEAHYASGLALLGGDLFQRLDSGRFVPLHQSWFCDRDVSEPFECFLDRSFRVASGWLANYTALAPEFTFVVFVADDGEGDSGLG